MAASTSPPSGPPSSSLRQWGTFIFAAGTSVAKSAADTVVNYAANQAMTKVGPRIKARLLLDPKTEKTIDLEKVIATEKLKIFQAYQGTWPTEVNGLLLILNKLSLRFSSSLQKQMQEDPLKKHVFVENDPFLNQLCEQILLRILNNLIDVDKNQASTSHSVSESSPLVRIFSGLSELVLSQFNEIDEQEFKSAFKENDKNKIQQMFSTLTRALLSILMPNGKNDIPLPNSVLGSLFGSSPLLIDESSGINAEQFTNIEKHILPDLLAELYYFTMCRPYFTEKDKSRLMEKYCPIVDMIGNVVAKYIVEKCLPTIMEEKAAACAGVFTSSLELTENAEALSTVIKFLAAFRLEITSQQFSSILFNHLKDHVHDLFLHTLASLKEESENTLPSVAKSFLTIIVTYFNQKEATSAHSNWEIIKNQVVLATVDKETKIALFKPLARELLDKIGLREALEVVRNQLKLEQPVDALLENHIIPSLALLLMNTFCDMNTFESGFQGVKADLQQALVIAPATNTRITTGDAAVQGARAACIVTELEKLLKVLVKDIGIVVDKYIADLDFSKMLNKQILDNGLGESEVTTLTEGLTTIVNDQDPAMVASRDYIKTKVYESLFRIFTLLVKATPQEGTAGENEHLKILLPAKISGKVVRILIEHPPELARFEQIFNNQEMSEKEKEAALIALFKPATDALIELVNAEGSGGFRSTLPVPEMLKEPIHHLIVDSILPAFFREAYFEMTTWTRQAEENKAALQGVFCPPVDGATEARIEHMSGLAKAIGTFVEKFIPYFLKTNSQKAVSLIEESLAGEYFEALGDEEKPKARALVARNIQVIGENGELSGAWNAASIYVEGFALKILTKISQKINLDEINLKNEETGESVHLLNLLMDNLHQVMKHFEKINHSKDSTDALLTLFQANDEGSLLHSAMENDLDVGITDEQKQQHRIEHFCKPLAIKLLQLAGLEACPEDFPVPNALREKVWAAFKDEMLPEILYHVTQVIKDPITIKKALIKSIGLLEQVENAINAPADEESAPADEEQTRLDGMVGNFLLNFVQFAPSYLDEFPMLNIHKMKELGAPALGKIIRQTLGDKTIVGLINDVFKDFAITPPGQQEVVDGAALDRELINASTGYISKQLKEFVKAFVETKWKDFQERFDAKVSGLFENATYKKYAEEIKKFLDKICRTLFIDFLEPVWNFLLYTVAWYFIHLHINYKMAQHAKGLNHPITENLIMKLIETTVDRLLHPEKVQPEPLPMNEERYEFYSNTLDQASHLHRSSSLAATESTTVPPVQMDLID